MLSRRSRNQMPGARLDQGSLGAAASFRAGVPPDLKARPHDRRSRWSRSPRRSPIASIQRGSFAPREFRAFVMPSAHPHGGGSHRLDQRIGLQIRKLCRDVPCPFVTCAVELKRIHDAMAAGAAGYCTNLGAVCVTPPVAPSTLNLGAVCSPTPPVPAPRLLRSPRPPTPEPIPLPLIPPVSRPSSI